MRVLITDGHTRTALAVARSLGSKGHQPIIAASMHPCLAGRSMYAWKTVRYPDPHFWRKEFIEELVSAAKKYNAEMILPVTDTTISLISANRHRFEPKIIIPLPKNESIEALTSKSRLVKLARELEIPLPTTHLITSSDQRHIIPRTIQYPIVIKVSTSQIDTGGAMVKGSVKFADTPDELAEILEGLLPEAYPVLLQERIYGDGIGFFTIFKDGRSQVNFFHRRLRERPYTGGESTLREASPYNQELFDYSTRLLRHVDWFGPAMVEFKIDNRDRVPKLMEVNGRFWGSLQLAIDSGVDFPDILVKIVQGDPLPTCIDFKLGTKTWWILGDADAMIGAIRRGMGERDTRGKRLKLGSYFWHFINPRHWTLNLDTLSRKDPKPFFHELNQFVKKFGQLALSRYLPGLRQDSSQIRGMVHVHSTYSYDGTLSVEELAGFFRERGLNFIALTDHADTMDQEKTTRFVEECDRLSDPLFQIIPGLEFESKQGLHILALGQRTYFEETDVIKIVKRIKQDGGIPILAHPPIEMPDVSEELIRELVGVEIWNGPHDGPVSPSPYSVKLLRQWQKINPSLIAFEGADFHHVESLKPVQVMLDESAKDEKSILASLRDGRFRIWYMGLSFPSLGKSGIFRRGIYYLGRWLVLLVRKYKFLRNQSLPVPASMSGQTSPKTIKEDSVSGTGRKPIRILNLIETGNPGGAEFMMLSLLRELDRENFLPQVTLIKKGWLLDQFDKTKIPVKVISMRKGRNLLFTLRLIRFLRQQKIELIHSHEFTMNLYGFIASRIIGIPFIGTIHGNISYLKPKRRKIAYNLIQRWQGKLVAVSGTLRQELHEVYGINTNQMKVIYNGIRIPESIDNQAAKAKYGQEFGFDRQDILLGAVGSLYEVKGHQYLIDALPLILKDQPQARLMIIGQGYLEQELKQRCRNLSLENRVTFTGFRSDVDQILPILDIVIQPSLHEGLSLVLLEAMAAAKPIVTTRVGGNPEIITDEVTGLLIQPKNPEQIAQAVNRILADEPLARQLGANALELVKDRFSVNHMVGDYQRLYRELLLHVEADGNTA